MEITEKWLKEKSACQFGIEWFLAQKETDGVKVVKSLIVEKKLDWANWEVKSNLGGLMQRMQGMVIDSPIEEYLWHALEKEELSFMAKRQFEIGPYRIDIAFPVAKVAIECDGAEYHRSNQLQ